MTIFYSKRTGEIKSICTGIQNMDYFGNDKEDFKLIWDCIVVEFDRYILDNYKLFKVNLENKQLEMLPNKILNKYHIASN